MNALSPHIEATELEKIEDALHRLLQAATEADRAPPLTPPRGPISASVLALEAVDRITSWTPAQRDAAALFMNPVAEALRLAVRTLGERLHEIGGQQLMTEVLDRVAERDPEHWGRRVSIMDHRWDGIGRTADHPGWCV